VHKRRLALLVYSLVRTAQSFGVIPPQHPIA
jgi:hypothetical protein